MSSTRYVFLTSLVLGSLLVLLSLCHWLWAQGPDFGAKLSEEDRKVFAKRFEKELWPLLVKGGKDGCVGCHHARHNTSLRFEGDASKNFRMLLKEGFFLKDDPGSLLARVAATNKKERMPPGNRPMWREAEVKLLREFVNDLDRKLNP
jgi:hypothetical protein